MAVFVFRGSCYTRFCEDMKQRERERESISSSLFFIWSLQPCQTFMVFKRSWLQAMGKPRPPAAVLSSSSSSRRQLRLWPAAGSRSCALRLPAATTAPPAAERCPGLLWDLLQVHCGMSFIFSEWVVASGSFRTRQRRETRSARVFTKSIY